MPRAKPYIIYHHACTDGFGAAYAAWKKFDCFAEYYSAAYGQEAPNVEGKDVYLVDFSYDRKTVLRMVEQANSVTILDHHKSAEDVLKPLLEQKVISGVFDMDKSGAVLTWEHFHPEVRIPKLLKHIQDRDLWLFDMPGTKEVLVSLNSLPMDFDVWDKLVVADLRREGVSILRHHMKQVEAVLDSVFKLKVGDYEVPCVNCPPYMASDVGHILSKGCSFSSSWHYDGNSGLVKFSLRSDEKGADVAQIAEIYGGGGHKHAAGFTIDGLGQRPLGLIYNPKEKKKKVHQPKKVGSFNRKKEKVATSTPIPVQPPLDPNAPIPSQRTLLRTTNVPRSRRVVVKAATKKKD